MAGAAASQETTFQAQVITTGLDMGDGGTEAGEEGGVGSCQDKMEAAFIMAGGEGCQDRTEEVYIMAAGGAGVQPIWEELVWDEVEGWD